jgi:hypothetical protein
MTAGGDTYPKNQSLYMEKLCSNKIRFGVIGNGSMRAVSSVICQLNGALAQSTPPALLLKAHATESFKYH